MARHGIGAGRRIRTPGAALLAVLLAAATLSACGGSGDSGGAVTLTFWTHTHPPMIKLNRTLIAEYQRQHPNVRIEYQQIPNDEFDTKMLTAMSNGTGPDVLNLDDTTLRGEYLPKRLLAPIDYGALGAGSEDALKNRYLPRTLDGASADGQLYGLPSEFNATAFAVNTQHFADAGLDPNPPPKTWQDVTTDAKKLAAAGHQQAFSFLYLHSGWYTQQLQTLLNQTGGTITDPGHQKATVTSPQARAAVSIWAGLATGTERTADPNKTSREATAPFNDLATGRQSMAMVYPWAMEQIRESNPDTFAKLKLVPLPQLNPAAPVNRWYGYYWGVSRASEHQQQAWQFISYLASQSQRWLSDVKFIQPVKGWDTSPAGKGVPGLDVWSTAYRQGKFDEVAPHFAEIKDAVMTMINDTVFDRVAIPDAANKAAGTIDRSLGN
ncbi:ABC-type glycerol-3-phosphate transport system substrate-binding protein [Amycolatopsis sulphurea]|uniref:ABC-type glycerol-3-phosphate transport system substrate-binding protein n=1 Tax=Amycolatopsis sulphurea TaxID=76022 RepID=A0A2A9FBK4_9PSEU|nr:sugar ABC transporter substrate-binding protein [Amycolatopsis sulphurea]PFG47932.1 ABC-type glycerol-3-phosphate transport system substrate-binding protein [Amycolatopsis sulphurea]